MILKDGKTYRDGRGVPVTVSLKTWGGAETTYPFQGDNGQRYTETGEWINATAGGDIRNLVEEVES